MILGKSREQIELESIAQLTEGGRITNVNRGGQARVLLDAVGDQIFDIYQAVDANYSQSFIDLASGQYLNLLAATFGLARQEPVAAQVLAEDKVIKFSTVDGAPLATYLPSKILPVNTKITSAAGQIIFFVSENVVFNDVQAEVFVPATAHTSDIEFSVGISQLISPDM